MKSYIAAAVQMAAGSSKKENRKKAISFIEEAAGKGAKLIALPEVFLWRGKREEERDNVETIPGETSRILASLAQRHKLFILAGSYLEKATNTHSYNTSIFINPAGKIIAKYRKIHLFDANIPGKVKVKESATKKPGKSVVTVKTSLGTFGFSICYDLRFPELHRSLSDKGAEIIFIPSAFTSPTGLAHWEVLVRARAIENQCYIIAPNQVGENHHGHSDYGNSLMVDPWGKVIAQGSGTKEELIMARIDLSYLKKVRRELPSLSHRRL